MTAETLWKYVDNVPTVSRELHSGRESIFCYATDVVCVSSYRLISTSQLHALLHFHIWPINPVVYWEPLGASSMETSS